MKEILSHFQILTPIADPRPLKVGIINESYTVKAAKEGDPSFLLQRINHHIFTDVELLQQNIFTVTSHLKRELQIRGIDDVDRRVLTLIPTKDNQLYYKTPDGDFWRVYRFIEGAQSYNTINAHFARLAGEAFGDFQTMLSSLPADQIRESIPHFHDIEFRLKQLHQSISNNLAGRYEKVADLINNIEHQEEEMCRAEVLHREGLLPKRINHCDTKVNNILFTPNGEVLCIVDLDTVMPGYVLSDFGDFMRTAACTAPEDEPQLDKIHVDLAIFKSYTKGYLSKAHFLTPLEKGLLPFGCRLMSYMQCARFLTDYLNGDTYYHIDYPDHNLVRAKAQWRLYEEQTKENDVMMEYIQSTDC